MRKLKLFAFLVVIAIVLAACGSKDDKPSSSADGDHGELVPEVTINTNPADESIVRYEAALMFQEEWEALGIPTKIEALEVNTSLAKIYDSDPRDYGAYISGWTGRVERLDPDMFIYSVFHSSNADVGGNNASGLILDEFDELAEQQRVEVDMDKRRELVFEAQEILADEVPIYTMYVPSLVQAYNKDKFDNIPAMAGEGLFSEWTPMMAEPLTDDKILKVAEVTDLDTTNPLAANTVYEWKNLRLIYDKLVRIGLDGTPQPAAATDWDIVDDTTIDITLRDGMTFHDGEPVDVEDVKFTFDYMIEWNTPYFLAFLNPIESVEVVDDETVRFNLNEPYAPFINNTLAQIPILPKHIWEDIDNPSEEVNEHPIGSGPFKFKHWRRGEELATETFEDFYEDIEVDGYIYVVFSNHEGMIAALEKEEVDVTRTLQAPHVKIADELPFVQIEDKADLGWQYIGFNIREKPFDDKAFRQALAHTIDTETIVDVHMEGLAELGGAGLVISPANEFWYNPDVDRRDYDPEKARQILEEAGYTWDDEGRLRYPKE